MANENNTQWNNDYNVDETLFNDDDETYSYDEEEYKPTEKNTIKNKKNNVIIPIILVAFVLIAAILGFVLYKNSNNQSDEEHISDNLPIERQNSVDGDAFFDESINNEDDYNMLNVNFNDNKIENQNNSIQNERTNNENNDINNSKLDEEVEPVMVSWDSKARQNPFKPLNIVEKPEEKYETYGDVQFEIIEPPTKLVHDDNLTKLLQTQISGILYDETSPSAIINLDGQDRFVKAGDEVSGYKIKRITRNKVEISYKHNTYIASVGELFTRGKLDNESGIVNLNNKFAGRYKEKNIEE